MTVVVPDASVLLKWVLPGPAEVDVDHALRLRDAALRGDITLKVPVLWLFEVGNTLARRFPDQARDMLNTFIAFDLEESEPSQHWLDQVLTLTRDYRVTFYDAAYHALAIIQNGVFVTADADYVRKAGMAGAVILLRNWNTAIP